MLWSIWLENKQQTSSFQNPNHYWQKLESVPLQAQAKIISWGLFYTRLCVFKYERWRCWGKQSLGKWRHISCLTFHCNFLLFGKSNETFITLFRKKKKRACVFIIFWRPVGSNRLRLQLSSWHGLNHYLSSEWDIWWTVQRSTLCNYNESQIYKLFIHFKS